MQDFSKNLGETLLRVRPCTSLHEYGNPGPAESLASLGAYMSQEPATGVIFENDYHLVYDAIRDAYAAPSLLSEIHGAPIFSAGRGHTGVGFHHHHESWLAQLVGRKVWLLLPPGASRPPSVPPWWHLGFLQDLTS